MKGGRKIERLHDRETAGNEGDGDHQRKHSKSDQRENEGKKGGDVWLLRNNPFLNYSNITDAWWNSKHGEKLQD